MRSIIPMRTAKTGYILLSSVIIMFGLLLTIRPEVFQVAIAMVVGVFMILFGIIKMVGYFSKDLFRLAFQYDLAFGLLLIVLGVIVLTKPDNLLNFLCIAIGVAILADGLFKIQMSLDARQFGIHKWWMIFAFAIITGIIGLLLVFKPAEGSLILVRLLGVALMAEGIVNLITAVTTVKIIKHQKPDVFEGEWREL